MNSLAFHLRQATYLADYLALIRNKSKQRILRTDVWKPALTFLCRWSLITHQLVSKQQVHQLTHPDTRGSEFCLVIQHGGPRRRLVSDPGWVMARQQHHWQGHFSWRLYSDFHLFPNLTTMCSLHTSVGNTQDQIASKKYNSGPDITRTGATNAPIISPDNN